MFIGVFLTDGCPVALKQQTYLSFVYLCELFYFIEILQRKPYMSNWNLMRLQQNEEEN